MNRYIVTVTYKDISDDGKPYISKEKFSVKASTLNSAKSKADKAMKNAHLDEYVLEDIHPA